MLKDMHPVDQSVGQQITRYKALLGVSSAIASQHDLNELLHSISCLLSKVVPFDMISLLLVDQEKGTAQLYALEAGAFKEDMPIGMEVPYANSRIAEVVRTQQPYITEDCQAEIAKIPELAKKYRLKSIRSSCTFPVSSARRVIGAMIFAAKERQKYSEADIELMGAVASHVSVLMEGILALESAEDYRAKLEHERDRLNLLLEINNHIITHLDVTELLQAASTSIRRFVNTAFSGFWLFEEGTNQLQCVTLDFPERKTKLDKISSPPLTEEELEVLRMRVVTVRRGDEIDHLPSFIAASLRSESIASLAFIPLMGSSIALGSITLGSKEEDAFTDSDLQMLSQVANQISLALENAIAYRRLDFSCKRLAEECHYLEAEIQAEYNFEDIVGSSPALKKVLNQVAIVAPTDATVLLVGETGTGKELIARAIHNHSTRNERTFVRLNCAAIPQGLLESEIFGHEKGAFTGALNLKRGRMELAHEGTLFLDEIGDIDLSLQPKLLRALQEREFERLGSSRTIHVDVRLIAATNRNLEEMVSQGSFREDLYYRLNVFPIYIPPLRERIEDIPLLAEYFVNLIARRMRKTIRSIPSATLQAMTEWSWPGNVRELQNFIERSVILTRGDSLMAPIAELHKNDKPARKVSRLPATAREEIIEALRASGGRLAGADGAAERLGLKRTTLLKRMGKLNISRLDYAGSSSGTGIPGA